VNYTEGEWIAYKGANGHWYVRCPQDVAGMVLIADCGIEGEANARLIAEAPAMHKTLANVKYAWDTKIDAKGRYYHEVQARLFEKPTSSTSKVTTAKKSRKRRVSLTNKQLPNTGIRSIR